MKKNNIFSTVAMGKVDSNVFDLSHNVRTSFRMGELAPTCLLECVPGDKFKINTESMFRLAPLVSPVMHRVNVTQHFFFVPNRILWPNWEKFIVRDDSNGTIVPPRVTYDTIGSDGHGTLGSYLGYQNDAAGGSYSFTASPFALSAYMKIYDEYYRDQNLQNEIFTSLVDGDNSLAYASWLNNRPIRRAWMHDYFTSCLPFAQKGEAVQIPLTQEQRADVEVSITDNPPTIVNASGVPQNGALSGDFEGPASGVLHANGNPAYLDPNGSMYVDIQGQANDINTLRRAFRLQEWLEKNARAGTRYIENILAHFGVRTKDYRLQRPEYLGGSYQRVQISEVLSTAQTNQGEQLDVPVGYMAGHGISVGGGASFDYTVQEHGFIIGITNVQPVTGYYQGLHRMHTRFDPLDYYWPTFANIGEQEVKVKELWMDADIEPEQLEETFGYIPRYSEYKYMNDTVGGEMRGSLDFWHMARKFDEKPVLSSEFIECNPRTDIFAVQDDVDHIYATIYNNIRAVRKMPVFGVPTI